MEKRPDMPVQYLKGVGERRAQLFARLGIQDVQTLDEWYPDKMMESIYPNMMLVKE